MARSTSFCASSAHHLNHRDSRCAPHCCEGVHQGAACSGAGAPGRYSMRDSGDHWRVTTCSGDGLCERGYATASVGTSTQARVGNADGAHAVMDAARSKACLEQSRRPRPSRAEIGHGYPQFSEQHSPWRAGGSHRRHVQAAQQLHAGGQSAQSTIDGACATRRGSVGP